MRRATLRRRLAALTEVANDKVRRRARLREKAQVWDSIRAALAEAKIDPAPIKTLWPVIEAANELSRLDDTPEMRRADAAFIAQNPLASRPRYAAGAVDRAAHFAGRPPPQPGASLLDWYAWSLAARPRP